MGMRSVTRFAVVAALGLSAFGISVFAAPPVPRPAKELEIVEPNGKHDLLTSYRGKVVLVQFLYTTCPHCQAYSQLLSKIQKEYGPKGFQALGVAFNDADNGMVANYIAQNKVNFPIGPALRDTVLSFMGFSMMDQVYVPQIALVDKKGQIREQSEPKPVTEGLQNEAHLRSMIDKLLAEGPGASSGGANSGKAAPPPATKKPTS